MVPMYWKWSEVGELLSLLLSDNQYWFLAECHNPILSYTCLV